MVRFCTFLAVAICLLIPAAASAEYEEPYASPPVITITSPANGLVTYNSTVLLAYTVAYGGSQAPICDRPPVSVVQLVPGVNTLSVSCADVNANVVTAAVEVRYVPPADDRSPKIKIARRFVLGPVLRLTPTCPAGCTIQLTLKDRGRRLSRYTGKIAPEESGQVFALKLAKRYRTPVKRLIKARRKVTLGVVLVDPKGRRASRTVRVVRAR